MQSPLNQICIHGTSHFGDPKTQTFMKGYTMVKYCFLFNIPSSLQTSSSTTKTAAFK